MYSEEEGDALTDESMTERGGDGYKEGEELEEEEIWRGKGT